MEERYIVSIYRRERLSTPCDDQEGDERIIGVVEDIKRGLRNPFQSAEELWRLINSYQDTQ